MPLAAAEEGAADGGDPVDTETPPGHRDSTGRGDPAATETCAFQILLSVRKFQFASKIGVPASF